MTEEALLAKLHDITLPEPIGFWPQALGFKILFTIGIIGIFYFLIQSYKKYHHSKPKREALRLLKNYEAKFQQDKNTLSAAIEISALLRRVALAYFPNQDVAHLEGQAWLLFLTGTAKGLNFETIGPCLIELPYQRLESTIETTKIESLFQLAHHWIKQRGKSCLH